MQKHLGARCPGVCDLLCISLPSLWCLFIGKQFLGLSFLKIDDLDTFEEACYFTECPSCGSVQSFLVVELKLCTFVRNRPSGGVSLSVLPPGGPESYMSPYW